jgi:hypothetical protein
VSPVVPSSRGSLAVAGGRNARGAEATQAPLRPRHEHVVQERIAQRLVHALDAFDRLAHATERHVGGQPLEPQLAARDLGLVVVEQDADRIGVGLQHDALDRWVVLLRA